MSREKEQSRQKLSDTVKAAALKWWVAGMCYFFIGFGTSLGEVTDPFDLIFCLGLGLGLIMVFLYYPIAYRMFDMIREGAIDNQSYFERTGWQNALRKLAEIFKNMFLVFLVYLSYQSVNLLLQQLWTLPAGTVLLPGEPIGFATFYLIYDNLLTGLLDTVKGAVRKEKMA